MTNEARISLWESPFGPLLIALPLLAAGIAVEGLIGAVMFNTAGVLVGWALGS